MHANIQDAGRDLAPLRIWGFEACPRNLPSTQSCDTPAPHRRPKKGLKERRLRSGQVRARCCVSACCEPRSPRRGKSDRLRRRRLLRPRLSMGMQAGKSCERPNHDRAVVRLCAGGCPYLCALFNAQNRRYSEETEGHVERPVIDPAATGAFTVCGNVFFVRRRPSSDRFSPSRPATPPSWGTARPSTDTPDRRGSPSVDSSQSRMPMIRGSVG